MKMPWQWESEAAVEELRREMAAALSDAGVLRSHIEKLLTEQKAQQNLVLDLKLELDQRDDEIRRLQEKLKAHETPQGRFYTCQCSSNRFHTVRPIVGWKEGEDRANPLVLGATVMCLDCGSLWHVDHNGIERAKAVKPEKPDKEREKPPSHDSDLRFSGRRRP